MTKHAIFLSGPVGVGKTTLGRALAGQLGAEFIDGDDFLNPDRPWYCSILQTSKAVVRAGFGVLEDRSAVVIAFPLNCVDWIYFRRIYEDAGVRSLFVSLRASYSSIVDENRGRTFSQAEHDRIRVMIAEGYSERPFSDVVVDTDVSGFAVTLAQLEAEIGRAMSR